MGVAGVKPPFWISPPRSRGSRRGKRATARPTGAAFARVFERIVYYQAMETDEWSHATIQIVAGKGEYDDRRVVEDGSGSTVRERWAWDTAAQGLPRDAKVKPR